MAVGPATLLAALCAASFVPQLPPPRSSPRFALASYQAPPLLLAQKKLKSGFEQYLISGDGSDMFPVPTGSVATRVHKKHAEKGASLQKLGADPAELPLPSLNLGALPGMRVHHVDPLVAVADGLLTAAECAATVKLTGSDAAECIHSATFSASAAGGRTSTTWYVRYQDVPGLLARAMALTGAPLSHFEEPQVVRYEPGEYFNWHYDEVPAVALANGGQRRMTMLFYLSEPEGGTGATAFRDLRVGGNDAAGEPLALEVRPAVGRALVFFPCTAGGRPDDRTLHAGRPPRTDKWIAQLWLHERDYRPTGPAGTSHRQAAPLVLAEARRLGLAMPAEALASLEVLAAEVGAE